MKRPVSGRKRAVWAEYCGQWLLSYIDLTRVVTYFRRVGGKLMGMPAAFVTALSALLLIYADLLDWPVYAIVGLVFVSAVLVAMSAKKYSQWAAGFVVVTLVVCDAISRSGQTELNSLHSATTLGDLAYASCLFAAIGWTCGYFVRLKHAVPEGKMEIYNPPRPSFIISPALNRRRMPRASNQ